jgi:hypothetical protein
VATDCGYIWKLATQFSAENFNPKQSQLVECLEVEQANEKYVAFRGRSAYSAAFSIPRSPSPRGGHRVEIVQGPRVDHQAGELTNREAIDYQPRFGASVGMAR